MLGRSELERQRRAGCSLYYSIGTGLPASTGSGFGHPQLLKNPTENLEAVSLQLALLSLSSMCCITGGVILAAGAGCLPLSSLLCLR